MLQVLQAKLLQSLDRSNVNTDAVKDLRVVMDFALMATKHSAKAIGRDRASCLHVFLLPLKRRSFLYTHCLPSRQPRMTLMLRVLFALLGLCGVI